MSGYPFVALSELERLRALQRKESLLTRFAKDARPCHECAHAGFKVRVLWRYENGKRVPIDAEGRTHAHFEISHGGRK